MLFIQKSQARKKLRQLQICVVLFFSFFLLRFVWNVGHCNSGSRVSSKNLCDPSKHLRHVGSDSTITGVCFSSPVSRLLLFVSQRVSPLQSLAIKLQKQSGMSVCAATFADLNCVYGTSVPRCLEVSSRADRCFHHTVWSGLAP